MSRSVRRGERRIPLADAGHKNRPRDRFDGHAETAIRRVECSCPGLYPGKHARWPVLREEYRLPHTRHRLLCTFEPAKRRAVGEYARHINVPRRVEADIETLVVFRATCLNQPDQLS